MDKKSFSYEQSIGFGRSRQARVQAAAEARRLALEASVTRDISVPVVSNLRTVESENLEDSSATTTDFERNTGEPFETHETCTVVSWNQVAAFPGENYIFAPLDAILNFSHEQPCLTSLGTNLRSRFRRVDAVVLYGIVKTAFSTERLQAYLAELATNTENNWGAVISTKERYRMPRSGFYRQFLRFFVADLNNANIELIGDDVFTANIVLLHGRNENAVTQSSETTESNCIEYPIVAERIDSSFKPSSEQRWIQFILQSRQNINRLRINGATLESADKVRVKSWYSLTAKNQINRVRDALKFIRQNHQVDGYLIVVTGLPVSGKSFFARRIYRVLEKFNAVLVDSKSYQRICGEEMRAGRKFVIAAAQGDTKKRREALVKAAKKSNFGALFVIMNTSDGQRKNFNALSAEYYFPYGDIRKESTVIAHTNSEKIKLANVGTPGSRNSIAVYQIVVRPEVTENPPLIEIKIEANCSRR